MAQNEKVNTKRTSAKSEIVSSSIDTKRCFVTVGATASFVRLLRAVLDPAFVQALHEHGYTELQIQYGKDGKKTFDDYTWALGDDMKKKLGIDITGFDFKDGLRDEMLLVKRRSGRSSLEGKEGCIISHAGSGSILDAMRLEIPLIVVPNPDLLHNHQLELAEELAEQKYVVHGHLDNLAEALPQVEEMSKKMKSWPPKAGSGNISPGQALATVMDDEMGWVD